MSKDSLILGIESSCDDTSVALVRGNCLVDCIVISSKNKHSPYGGIVPEIAAREHEKQIIPLVDEIFNRAGVSWREITHIAYTENPGLVSCLLVGKLFAKTLSFVKNKKLIPVNHVYGHIFSPFINKTPLFPFLALVVSGKTTALYYVKSCVDIELLDETMDNALGEVYDKVARELGLGYPGGVEIDKLFNKNIKTISLFKNNMNPAQRFSYSGVLSAVCRLCRTVSSSGIENKNEYIATVFQKWVIDALVNKVRYWSIAKKVNRLSVSGGVAANSYLREEIQKLNMEVDLVEKAFSGDNGAMIAYYASHLI